MFKKIGVRTNMKMLKGHNDVGKVIILGGCLNILYNLYKLDINIEE